MHKRRLGRTGLEVSEIGLGGVWFAARDRWADYGRVIRRALELGVDLIDTAPGYKDSEAVVGEALTGGLRDRVWLSTKYYPYGEGDKLNLSGEALARSMAQSLARLKTSRVDFLHLHWVHSAEDVKALVRSDLAATLQRFKSTGHIRHLAVSEASELDGTHEMLAAAIKTGLFDSIMVTYNVFLQTAERGVLAAASQAGVGVLVMMPLNQPGEGVGGLISPARVAKGLEALRAEKAVPDAPPYTDPEALAFMLEGGSRTYAQAALRFVLDRPEVTCALVGTSSLAHLEEDLAAADQPPLKPDTHARLRDLFGSVTKQVK